MVIADRLTERGYAPSPVERVLHTVDRAPFLPARYRFLADVDVPAPVIAGAPEAVAPSPRAATVLLTTLDMAPGEHVLLDVKDGGYLAALAAEAVGAEGHVTLATGTDDPRLARIARDRLRAAGYGSDRVTVTHAPPFKEQFYDRILLAEPSPVLPTGARHALTDWGVLVARTLRGGELTVMKIVRSGDDYAEILLGDVQPARRPLGAGVEEPWPLRRIFLVEDALARAWRGEPTTPEEADFQYAVEETYRRLSPRDDAHDWAVGRVLFHCGYVHLMSGDLENAEDAYRGSFTVLPTAEALTFLGWTWSFSGRYEDAIDACRHAIEVDPSFGNAYNDIGAYLLEMGREEEAETWLWRATRATRYTARAYPFANLARVHLMRGDTEKARVMLERALDEDPDYMPARVLLDRLLGFDVDETFEDEEEDDEGRGWSLWGG